MQAASDRTVPRTWLQRLPMHCCPAWQPPCVCAACHSLPVISAQHPITSLPLAQHATSHVRRLPRLPARLLAACPWQVIAGMIRHLLDGYNKPVPAILEIPSKDAPYDPSQDSVLQRVRFMFGEA